MVCITAGYTYSSARYIGLLRTPNYCSHKAGSGALPPLTLHIHPASQAQVQDSNLILHYVMITSLLLSLGIQTQLSQLLAEHYSTELSLLAGGGAPGVQGWGGGGGE